MEEFCRSNFKIIFYDWTLTGKYISRDFTFALDFLNLMPVTRLNHETFEVKFFLTIEIVD